jgi:hypothetical protein
VKVWVDVARVAAILHNEAALTDSGPGAWGSCNLAIQPGNLSVHVFSVMCLRECRGGVRDVGDRRAKLRQYIPFFYLDM